MQPRETMPERGGDGSVESWIFCRQPGAKAITGAAIFAVTRAICVAPGTIFFADRIKSAAGAIKSISPATFSGAGRT